MNSFAGVRDGLLSNNWLVCKESEQYCSRIRFETPNVYVNSHRSPEISHLMLFVAIVTSKALTLAKHACLNSCAYI